LLFSMTIGSRSKLTEQSKLLMRELMTFTV
jgi:hypothetical protein